jgi:hypothetical protein
MFVFMFYFVLLNSSPLRLGVFYFKNNPYSSYLLRTIQGCNNCFKCSEIGGSEILKCQTPMIPPNALPWLPDGKPACGHIIPRDFNGSLGIPIRNVVLAMDPTLADKKAKGYLYGELPPSTIMHAATATATAATAARANAGTALRGVLANGRAASVNNAAVINIGSDVVDSSSA